MAIDDLICQCETSLKNLENYTHTGSIKAEIEDEDVFTEVMVEIEELQTVKEESTERTTKGGRKKVKKEPPKQGGVYCSVCSKLFPRLTSHVMKEHNEVLTTADGENKLKCKICHQLTPKTPQAALGHFDLTHREFQEPKQCTYCPEVFLNHHAFVLHRDLERRQQDTFECHFCGFQVKNKFLLKKHLLKKHTAGVYCHHCARVYDTREAYQHHAAEVRKKKTDIFVCDVCGINFKNHVSLVNHRSVHFPTDNPCKLCPKVCKSLRSLKSHVDWFHAEKKFFCEICGRRYAKKSFLNKHIKDDHNTPKACDICNKSYLPVRLKLHMKLHSEERPYSCPYNPCNDKFKTVTSLRKHVYQHSKLRPYNCLHCETGYYSTDYLRTHYERSHGIVLAPNEIIENCRKVEPPFPPGVTIKDCKKF